MHSSSFAWGAITVVNALASGKGAAISIDLRVEVDANVTPDCPDIVVENIGFPADDVGLVQEVARATFGRFGLNNYGVRMIIDSQIPPGKGLKSSSAVCNAVTVALLDAIEKNLEDMKAVGLGVEVSKRRGISITGALDDALASYFGGFVVTDNLRMKLICRSKVSSSLKVVLMVPRSTTYTREVDLARTKRLSNIVDEIHRIASRGEMWNAMTLNGLVYAPALGVDSRMLFDALEAGALAASVTGTGPALAAVCDPVVVQDVRDVWDSSEGDTWIVGINNTRCGALVNE